MKKKQDYPFLLSIVIPCFSESHLIVDSLHNVIAIKGKKEIIVVAGSDEIERKARKVLKGNPDVSFVVIRKKEKRFAMLNTGAAKAKGEVLLFKHVDSSIPPNSYEEIRKARKSGLKGGSFTAKFHKKGMRYRIDEWILAALRDEDCFGDATQFFDKEAFDSLGGYASIPLMEDLEFNTRFRKNYGFKKLKKVCSFIGPEKCEKYGVRYEFLVARLFFLYRFCRISPHFLAKLYK